MLLADPESDWFKPTVYYSGPVFTDGGKCLYFKGSKMNP